MTESTSPGRSKARELERQTQEKRDPKRERGEVTQQQSTETDLKAGSWWGRLASGSADLLQRD